MVNGVFQIVAAVLFVVVHLSSDMGIIWLWVAGVYFAVGLGNLAVYAIRNKHQMMTVRKQAAKTAKEAEKSVKDAEKSVKEAERTANEAMRSALFARNTSSLPENTEPSEVIDSVK